MHPEEWKTVQDPQNHFYGKSLPENFSCPYGILFFYRGHNGNLGRKADSHSRYTLVVAKTSLTYYVDNAQTELADGEALLIYPHQQRYLYSSREMADRMYMTFLANGRQSYLPPPGKYIMTEQCRRHLSEALDAYQNNNILELVFFCTLLLSELSGQSMKTNTAVFSPAVSSAILYMEKHLSELFTLRTLAENCCISESYLRTLFRQELGMSPSEYLAALRMNAARQYLNFSGKNIQEIAQLCGFTSAFAFSHFFKRHQGCSPLHFRNSGGKTTR